MDDQGQTNPTPQGDQGGMGGGTTPEPTTPTEDQGGMGGETQTPEAPAEGGETPVPTGGEEQTPPAQPGM